MARKQPIPAPASAPSPNLAGLIQACKDEPDDDGLRLILADYLEDHGDPERAEFLRLSVEVHQHPSTPTDAASILGRMAQILHEKKLVWMGNFANTMRRPHFWRGFLGLTADTATLRRRDTKTWLAEQSPWVERLHSRYQQRPQVRALVNQPQLADFSTLILAGPALDQEYVRALAFGEHVTHLRELNLTLQDNHVTAALPLFEQQSHLSRLRSLALTGSYSDTTLRALVAAPFAPHLRRLKIKSGSRQQHLGVGVLAEAGTLVQLQSLTLSHQHAGKRDLEQLLKPGALPQLRELHLVFNKLTPEVISALAASPQLSQLEALSLNFCEINDEAAQILAASPHVANLRSLDLCNNDLNAAGVRAIAASPKLERLERLDLTRNLRSGGESGAAALYTLDRLTSLRDLDLTHANITDRALERLIAGPLAGRLRRLSLGNNPITARGVNTLATASTLRGLESLELEGCQLGSGDLTPFVRSTTLEGLLWLSIDPVTISESDLLALADGGGLPRLVFLMLTGDPLGPVTPRSWQALRESPRRRNAFFVGLPDLGDHLELGDLQSPFLVGHEYP